MKRYTLIAGIVAAAVGLSTAKPAAAITFDDNNKNAFTIDTSIDTTDIGQSIGVDFNGFVGRSETQGLTAEALFTVLDINRHRNTVKLQIDLTNTSSGAITASRAYIWPFFSTSQKIKHARITCVGSSSGSCSHNGVSIGNTDTLHYNFKLKKNLKDSLTIGHFYAKYKGIEGTGEHGKVLHGHHGYGIGEVPTPALLPGLVSMGIATFRKRKKNRALTAESST